MISHKHKCIFIHIPKNAGMSIYTFFFPGVQFHYDNPDFERLFGWCPKRKIHMQHATAKQLLETNLITEKQWKEYYKFTFVRNPWDRAYSDFIFVQNFSGVKGSFRDFILKRGNFESILNDNSNSKYLGDHLLPQTSFFDLEGIYKPDNIGRFENFEVDIQIVLSNLGIDNKFNIHSNSSKIRFKDYSNFYTDSKRDLIDHMYSEDIKRLNYIFEDKRKGIYRFKKLF